VSLADHLRDELAAAGRCDADQLNIGETALALAAAMKPGAARAPYRRHLESLAGEVAAYVGGHRGSVPVALRHEALVQVIHKRFGYVGTEDCFDDIEAASLMRVIDRRGGLPVAIGVLYLHAARHAGWAATGVDFPGRFLLRLDPDSELNANRIIFDPFDGGRQLGPPDLRRMLKAMAGPDAELNPVHYRKAGPRAVLLRLQNNIKIRHLDAQRPGAALRVLETMVALAPDDAALWREVGVLHARLDQIPDAVAALEECLRHDGSEQTRYSTSALLQELRGRLG